MEKNKAGGVCANVGCIPTKSLAASAELARKIKSGASASSGVRASGVELDFAAAAKKARTAASIVSQGVGFLLKSWGVEIVAGEAEIASPNEVKVNSAGGERALETKNVVIATGGSPFALPGAAFGGAVISGEELVLIEKVPKKVVIIGGGVEGVEYAGILASFGVDVTVIEMAGRILPMADAEAAALVAKNLAGLGVKILVNTKVEKIEGNAVFAGGAKFDADLVIVVIGKRPNVSEDAKRLGVKFGKRGIETDSAMRTSVAGVYAIGDVVGGGLAHVASEQGIVAAENIAGRDTEYGASAVPYAIFTLPEVAAVGDVSGGAASGSEANGVSIGVFPFAALGRATAQGERAGFVKVFANAEGVIVGCVIAGAHASDCISEAALAVRLKATLDDVCGTIHAHPTFPEAFQEAARAAKGAAIHLTKK